jgi:AcrR family transcriptional regulator
MNHNPQMAKRGSELTEHILYAAKNVFLEAGFERASMDLIAERAKTSKRTLYAHFESKEKLYLAIIELLREMYLRRIRPPGDYSNDPTEALVMFCGRYLEGLLFVWTIRMCRMIASEAERFPEGSARYFDVIFTTPRETLSTYIKESFGLTETASGEAAQELIGRVIFPRFTRTLFGIDPAGEQLDDEAIDPDFDLKPIRRAVADVLPSTRNAKPI